MAKFEITSSHVSGFVKRLKIIHNHGIITFSVLDKNFVLPRKATTFTSTIENARIENKNVLILFREMDGMTPEITGVITRPTWPQRKAASEGQGYEDIVKIGLESLAKNQNLRVTFVTKSS